MRKKLLSLVLALILCLALAAPAFAADSDFVIENGVLTKYNGPGGDVVIPDSVTRIGDNAFFFCGSLTSVTIPTSVTDIGYWAFSGCSSLTGVTIPGSVTSIGDGAFCRCSSLTAIQVDSGNQNYCSVDGVLFTRDMKTLVAYPCGKQGAYSIPDGVADIGYSAFENCISLTGVTIPNSVTGIGDRAFFGCSSLTGVAIPGSVTSIGEEAFSGCTGLTGMTIPSSVTSIGDFVFNECFSLTSVTIPSSVTSIGNSAFYECDSLTSVTIPGSVTSIETGAFMNCASLTSVTIPSSVTSIGEGAFWVCVSLTDVYYGGTEAQWKRIKFGDYNSSLLGAVIHYNSAAPDTPSQSKTASPTNDRLNVNGEFQTPAVYKIGGSNYFKIRDLAVMLNGTEKQFDVGYDAALNSVTVTTGKGYSEPDAQLIGALGGSQPAAPSNDTIYIDGQKIDVTVYKIGGSNFFMLRDLGKALDFYVGWTREAGVFIDTGKPYSE